MLSGLLHPTGGEVSVMGHVPWRREAANLRRMTLIMGQRNQLAWDIPVIDSFELNRAIFGIAPGDCATRLAELVELLELGTRDAARCRCYRGAMRSQDDGAVIEWLLESKEPAIRRLVRRDLLDEAAADDEGALLEGPAVRALLAGQQPDGGFGVHPYSKWTGAHWRLVSLVELGVPPGEPRCLAAMETVLAWLTGAAHRRNVPVVRGLARRCASQEGNALAVACRLGMAGDARVGLLASSLVAWQWRDGGWNCDRRPEAHRSSFHETLAPIWGLHEYAVATGARETAAAARRGAELLLDHRVVHRLSDGAPIDREWLTTHWPPYWHYDLLQGLVVLSRLGLADDPRCADAVAVLERRRTTDGRWRASSRWWGPPGATRAAEAVDWRHDDAADRIATLRALGVLRAAGKRSARDGAVAR